MTGVIQGSRTGDSPFIMQSVDIQMNLTCEGSTNSAGVGSMTCSDGSVFDVRVPPNLYGELSGSYTSTLENGWVVASGWGEDADIALLTQMLDSVP